MGRLWWIRAVWTAAAVWAASAQPRPSSATILPMVPGQERQPTDLEKLVGQSAYIAPSAYQYRADRKPEQNPPESWIGLMKYAGLPWDKPLDAGAPALKKVLCGLLWEEVRPVLRVALAWTGSGQRRPKADQLVVSVFDAEAKGIPTWWNKAVLRLS